MDYLTYQAMVLDMVRESLRPRNAQPVIDEPRTECCMARLVSVGDEMYACEACGGLCSDGTLSMP